MKNTTQYWLFKSEPTVYSIDDMKSDKTTYWEGVRNYQARNFLRSCETGDFVLFYHSNAKPPGVAGICTVTKKAYPDPEQFDEDSNYFDPKSSKENPRWSVVDVEFKKKFKEIISLNQIRENSKLQDMRLVQKGNRLSVMPITKQEFNEIVSMSK